MKIIEKKKIYTAAKKSLIEASKDSAINFNSKIDKIILLGDGSLIDSIAFVNFIVGTEDYIKKETKKDISIKIDKIHSINKGKKKLIFIDFVNALFKLLNEKE